jgi:hypothetical protein
MLCAWLEKFRRIGFVTSGGLRCANPPYGLRADTAKTPTASPRTQAQSRNQAATKQPDGQISQTLSSPAAKNIPLNIEAKSPAYLVRLTR